MRSKSLLFIVFTRTRPVKGDFIEKGLLANGRCNKIVPIEWPVLKMDAEREVGLRMATVSTIVRGTSCGEDGETFCSYC